jgi:drug/metabolite transporter (DMT)-like permease
MLIALFLCINPKRSGEKLSAKWFVSCIAFFCAGGFIGMFYKVFGGSDFSGEINAMMLSASVASCILFFAVGFSLNKLKKLELPKIHKDAIWYVIFAGITGCIYIRLNVSLSAIIPSAVFFPVANGGIVVITTLVGAFLFKEKLNRIQISGVLLGLAALIITGCGKTIFDMMF